VAVSRLDIAAGITGVVGRHRALVVRCYDLAAATAAWPLALALRRDLDLTLPDLLLRDLVLVGLLALVLFELGGVHRAFWRFATAADLATVALGSALLAGAVTVGLFLIDRLQAVPRSVPLLYAILTLLLLAGARIGWMLWSRRPANLRAGAAVAPATAFRPVLLVGAGEGAALAIELLRHAAGPVYRPVAILDEKASLGRQVMGVPVIGRLDELGSALARLQVRGLRPVRILVTGSPANFPAAALRRLRERAYAERLPVDFLPDLVRLRWVEEGAAEVAGPTPVEDQPPAALAYALAKRAIDTTVAATVLLLGAPFLLVVGLAVWLGIDRAVLFRQMRRGRGLVPFTLVKFQTLRDPIGPDGRWLTDEERQTPLGRLLRRFKIDELPQLWNVLVGDMALVGPRPLVDRDLLALPDRGRARAAMRPGLTGWAQVNGGQILGPREKHALDLWYIRHASLALDLRILWLTAVMVVRGERVNDAEVRRALAELEPAEAAA
jgi:lipopolysaccharide/colanic/teichoic acid biosynthesis glycosyltransferase